MLNGVPRLKMEEHLKERKATPTLPARRTTENQSDASVRR
ncbi:hypothetical protein BH23ACI1_BH23ACI1_03300 [soil metagenome]